MGCTYTAALKAPRDLRTFFFRNLKKSQLLTRN
jgi:hypothetical protein